MAATELILADNVARTASGTGESIPIKTVSMLDVAVNCSAASGTTPALTVWLEFSPDGKTNWYGKTADMVQTSTTTASEPTFNANQRNIVNAIASAASASAVFKHVAASYVRARWFISGTTPSFTFSVKAGGK